jgi:hypothetical protein
MPAALRAHSRTNLRYKTRAAKAGPGDGFWRTCHPDSFGKPVLPLPVRAHNVTRNAGREKGFWVLGDGLLVLQSVKGRPTVKDVARCFISERRRKGHCDGLAQV